MIQHCNAYSIKMTKISPDYGVSPTKRIQNAISVGFPEKKFTIVKHPHRNLFRCISQSKCKFHLKHLWLTQRTHSTNKRNASLCPTWNTQKTCFHLIWTALWTLTMEISPIIVYRMSITCYYITHKRANIILTATDTTFHWLLLPIEYVIWLRPLLFPSENKSIGLLWNCL